MLYFVITTLAVFFIASVIFQVKSLQVWCRKIDRLNLLPNYSFFAPKPLTNDYRLVYKFLDVEGSDWLEVPLYENFSLKRIIWNPFKYYNKGMIDSFNFLSSEYHALKEDDKDFILISEYYINVLKLVSDHVKKKDATVRFAIVLAEGIEEINISQVIFASAHQKL